MAEIGRTQSDVQFAQIAAGLIRVDSQAASVSDQMWAFWDVLPTVVQLIDAKPIRQLDRISILPTLLGKPQKEHPPLYWESHDGQGFHQAVRMGNWKAVRHGLKAPIELYDLAHDAGESRPEERRVGKECRSRWSPYH